jgi:hypothetical protein
LVRVQVDNQAVYFLATNGKSRVAVLHELLARVFGFVLLMASGGRLCGSPESGIRLLMILASGMTLMIGR